MTERAWNDEDMTAGAEDEESQQDKGSEPKRSQASLLVELARERFRFVMGDDGRPYAVAAAGPSIARPLRGRTGLREHLAKLYADVSHGGVPSASALSDAITVLEGLARTAVAPTPVHLRVAPYQDGVVLDLGTPDGRCVDIDPGGWRIESRSPVLFRRSALTSPLADPLHGGSLDRLAELLNVSQAGFRLLVGWLLAALIPGIPHPILALFGEQGTAKSTAARLLVSLIDPSPAPLRSAPRDVKQWSVTASASWTVCLDNCSGFPPWLSDTLCKAATGDGVVDRALYSDDDVVVLAFRRVVALTAIDAGALRGDLAERLLPVELDRIPEHARRRESEVLDTFDALHAETLGALLSLLCRVLDVLPVVELGSYPRMADFARVLAALDKTTGWATLDTYRGTAADIAETVIDSDPFATAIRELVAPPARTWTGTVTDLLARLTPDKPPKGWPKSVSAAGGALRRIVPALRSTGIAVEFDRDGGKRTVEIRRDSDDDDDGTTGDSLRTFRDKDQGQADPDRRCEPPSSPSLPSQTAPDLRKRDDSTDSAAVTADDSNDGNDGRTADPNSNPSPDAPSCCESGGPLEPRCGLCPRSGAYIGVRHRQEAAR